MKKVYSILLSVVLGTSILFTGCGNSAKTTDTAKSDSSKPVTLTFAWWGTQVRHDATLKVIELYEQKHPNVKIEPQYQAYDGYFQKLSMEAASNNIPDLFQYFVGSSDSQAFTDKGLVEPLDSYIDKKLIDVSNISESSLVTGKANDGKIYGISLGENARGMVVDPEAYKKAGLEIPKNGYATWDDFEKDLPKLKEATGAYAADDFLTYSYALGYYARQNSKTLYDAKTIIGIDDKTYADFYTMKNKWIKNGWVPPYDVTLATKAQEDSQIAKGKAAVYVIPANQLESISKAAGKQLVMMPIPGPNAIKGMYIQAGSHISIASTSQNKEEAAKFIDFITNDVEANKILNAERGIPVSSVVRDGIKDGFTSGQKVAADFLTKVEQNSSPQDPNAPAGATQIDTFLKDLEQQIVYDKITPQDAYKTLKDAADKILQKK